MAILPPGTDLPAAYAGGSDEEQAFVQNLAMFLTSYFRVSAIARSFCAGATERSAVLRLIYSTRAQIHSTGRRVLRLCYD